MNKLEIHGRMIQTVAWICGLSVIEYPIGRQRPVISFFYLVFITGTFGYAVKSFINLEDSMISFLRLSKKIILCILFGGIAFSYYVQGSVWLFRKEESECLSRLNEVTEFVVSIRSDIGFKNRKRNKMIQIIFWGIIAQQVICLTLKYDPDVELFSRIILTSVDFYPHILNLYINLIFVNYLRIIQLNFAKINAKLKELSKFTDFSSYMSVYEIITIISRIKKYHLRLTRVSRSFNDLYGIYILLSMTLNFACIMLHLYDIYCNVYNFLFGSLIFNYKSIEKCLSMSVHAYVIIDVNDACSSTAMEASKTGSRIFELSNSGSSIEIDNEVERFSAELLQNPLVFTAHGFFVLNRGIVFDIIMTMISYLIVLVQLSMCEI